MENKELILYSVNLIESTISATNKLIDFYLIYGVNDNSLNISINNLLNGYASLIPILPHILTGRMDGRNYKEELIKSLQDVQVALVYADDYPENFRLAWQNFANYWIYYKELVLKMVNNDRIIQLFVN